MISETIQDVINEAIVNYLTQNCSFGLYLFGKKIVGSITYRYINNTLTREIKISNEIVDQGLKNHRYYIDKNGFDRVSVWRTSESFESEYGYAGFEKTILQLPV